MNQKSSNILKSLLIITILATIIFNINILIHNEKIQLPDTTLTQTLSNNSSNNVYILNMLKKTFGNNCQFIITDTQYQLVSTNYLNYYLQKNYEPYWYLPEYHDCDNIAFATLGQLKDNLSTCSLPLGIGIMQDGSTKHMTVLFLDNNSTFYRIEDYHLISLTNESFSFIMI